MKKVIYILIILLPSLGYSQIDSLSVGILAKKIDSIQFSVWKMKTKEMSAVGNIEEYEVELKRITLSKKDTELLQTKLMNSQSYSDTRALIYHFNIAFDLFSNASIYNSIRISGINGNINIDNKQTGEKFRNGCSGELGEFLIELLYTYRFSNLIDTFDIEGITTDTKKKK